MWRRGCTPYVWCKSFFRATCIIIDNPRLSCKRGKGSKLDSFVWNFTVKSFNIADGT